LTDERLEKEAERMKAQQEKKKILEDARASAIAKGLIDPEAA